MPDNVGYTPGSGASIAADDIGGVLHQRVKIGVGADGAATDVSAANPMPARADRTDNLLVMLSRIVKLLESNAIVDNAQRQRVTVDAMSSGLTLGTVTSLGTVTTVTTVNTVTAANNLVALAGMDREQYINIAKQTYAQSIRSQLTFT
jgi:hypothetical protein